MRPWCTPFFASTVLFAGADAWCCRACAKCMCTVYGVCPSPSEVQPPFSLPQLTVAQVADFIVSISPNGSRQWCTPGCALLENFNASLFIEHGWHGKRLASFLKEHESRFSADVVHNMTLREAHCEWLASHKILPSGLKSQQYLALVTRLQGALRSANASLDADGVSSSSSTTSSLPSAPAATDAATTTGHGEAVGKRRLKLLGAKRASQGGSRRKH